MSTLYVEMHRCLVSFSELALRFKAPLSEISIKVRICGAHCSKQEECKLCFTHLYLRLVPRGR